MTEMEVAIGSTREPGTFSGARAHESLVICPVINGAPALLSIGTDKYEMFAHGLYTDSRAIGNISPVMFGPFTSHYDLSTIGFGGSRLDHSGQFNHSHSEMTRYWKQLIRETE